jgi:hypothetical protein
MPFDGLQTMPYRGQSELFRRREWFSRDPVKVAEALEQKRRVAGESFVVLCQLLRLFDGGKNWMCNSDCDRYGNFCIRGGLKHIRQQRGRGDIAGVFISRAIRKTGGFRRITAFNDNCVRYSDVERVVERARELAAIGTL